MTEFRSRYNLLVTSVIIDGVQKEIMFEMRKNNGSSYITDDKKVIKALKEMKTTDYYLFKEDVEKEDPVVEEEKEEEYSIQEEITNISDAKEFLRAMGIPFQQLSNRNAILRKADEMKVSFPNLK